MNIFVATCPALPPVENGFIDYFRFGLEPRENYPSGRPLFTFVKLDSPCMDLQATVVKHRERGADPSHKPAIVMLFYNFISFLLFQQVKRFNRVCNLLIF